MSIDFQLRQSCPHVSVLAPALLDTDLKRLVLPYPIGAFGVVRIYANGLEIPSGGLFRLDPLKSVGTGPYAIPSDAAQVTVTTSSGTQVISLPYGKFVPQSEILLAFAPYANFVAITGGNSLSLSPVSADDTYLSVSGPASSLLGFQQLGTRAKTVFPGWRVLGDLGGKFISFVSPVVSSPVLEVSYPFEPSRCPRCLSSRVENDVAYDVGGELKVVENEDLLIQGVLKIILTELGSNPYHRWYGSAISRRVGMKATGTAASLLREDVAQALANFQDLQTKQARYQRISPEERLAAILAIQVAAVPNAPTAFQIDLQLRNASGRPVQFSTVFTVPGVTDLTRL